MNIELYTQKIQELKENIVHFGFTNKESQLDKKHLYSTPLKQAPKQLQSLYLLFGSTFNPKEGFYPIDKIASDGHFLYFGKDIEMNVQWYVNLNDISKDAVPVSYQYFEDDDRIHICDELGEFLLDKLSWYLIKSSPKTKKIPTELSVTSSKIKKTMKLFNFVSGYPFTVFANFELGVLAQDDAEYETLTLGSDSQKSIDKILEVVAPDQKSSSSSGKAQTIQDKFFGDITNDGDYWRASGKYINNKTDVTLSIPTAFYSNISSNTLLLLTKQIKKLNAKKLSNFKSAIYKDITEAENEQLPEASYLPSEAQFKRNIGLTEIELFDEGMLLIWKAPTLFIKKEICLQINNDYQIEELSVNSTK